MDLNHSARKTKTARAPCLHHKLSNRTATPRRFDRHSESSTPSRTENSSQLASCGHAVRRYISTKERCSHSMNSSIAELFLAYSVHKLRDMRNCVETCLLELNDEQVWERKAAHENTIGNLILHLCGNIRQWIMHGVGRETDVRTRDLEF